MTCEASALKEGLPVCPVCDTTSRRYLFAIAGRSHEQCLGCGLIANTAPVTGNGAGQHPDMDTAAEQQVARNFLKQLMDAGVRTEDRILLLTRDADHPLIELARAAGLRIDLYTVNKWSTAETTESRYDVAVLFHTLEYWPDPDRQLERLHRCLKTDGLLLVMFQSLDAWPIRFFKALWVGWQPEKHYHFSRKTIQLLLLKKGFDRIWLERDRRAFSLQHISRRIAQAPVRRILRGLCGLTLYLPAAWRRAPLRLPTSGVLATAQRGECRSRQLLSIIVPAYNERAHFTRMMDALLAKSLPGLGREIIIVESNSSDGTRASVLAYEKQPGVKIILQERPRGKGNAVREGFANAHGDILMIQDADMEYDFNDYDALLDPFQHWRELFVLGARHGGGAWKMRQFANQPILATLMNAGHFFSTTFINVLYGQKMKDPHTMFKIFRRDALYGLEFQSNYFDFDLELVIKLLLKHYIPSEIPVNYRSRSYKEGKKVDMLREPLRWLRVDLRNRFIRLRPPLRIRAQCSVEAMRNHYCPVKKS